MDIFNKTIINTNISLNYNEVKKNLDYCIINLLQNKYENKCSEYGLIKTDSIKILKRSNIYINDFYNSAIIKINIHFECLICNPKQNLVINCTVKDNIKPGIIAFLNPLEIIIPITLHSNPDVFKNYNEGDDIEIKILKSKFKLNDKQIQCIGILNSEEINKNIEDKEGSDDEILSDEDIDKEVSKSDNEEDEDDEDDEEDDEEEELNNSADEEDLEEDLEDDLEEDLEEEDNIIEEESDEDKLEEDLITNDENEINEINNNLV